MFECYGYNHLENWPLAKYLISLQRAKEVRGFGDSRPHDSPRTGFNCPNIRRKKSSIVQLSI